MREISDAGRIRRFMRSLAARSRSEAAVYFTGGASAVLIGWRPTTVDVDIKIVPEDDGLLRAIPELKESLKINVEFSSPELFLPPLPGWQERSPFVSKEGALSFRHYDFYAQALAKIERGHRQDLEDVRAMLQRELVRPRELLRHYQSIEPQLYRYPALDPSEFRKAVERFIENPD